MPFSLRQIAATHNALKSDFEARLTYDVIESESEFICLVNISRKKIHEVKQISPLPKSKREQKISQCDKES